MDHAEHLNDAGNSASMQSSADDLTSLRIPDLLAFLAVQRTSSVTAAARELRVTPSQVSKAIARIEEHARTRIVERTARGVTLTEAGMRIAPHIEAALERLRAVRQNVASGRGPMRLTVAAPSWVQPFALPAIAASGAGVSVCGYELAPSQLRAFLAEGMFDIAIVPGNADPLAPSWTSDRVGMLRKCVLAPRSIAERLAPFPVDAARLRELPWIGPTYQPHGRFVAVRDDCPLPETERSIVHQAATIGLALELAVATESLAFGPRIAARHFLARGALVQIPVAGWDLSDPLHVLCNGDRVLSRVRTAVVRALAAAIADDAG